MTRRGAKGTHSTAGVVGQVVQPAGQGLLRPLRSTLVPLMALRGDPPVDPGRPGVIDRGPASGALGWLFHGGIMYSQISVDKPISILYSVLTLNQEANMEQALFNTLMTAAASLLIALIVSLPWGAL